MRYTSAYITLFVLCLLQVYSYGYSTSQDSIPPVFTTFPQDITVSCNSDITSGFLSWYSNNAGGIADNGLAQVRPNIGLIAAQDSLNKFLSQGCANNGDIRIGFFALDSCNLRSDTTITVQFIIEDTETPIIVTRAQSKTVECTATVMDSLQFWLDTQGGAQVRDICSDTIIWRNYTWTDNLGNQNNRSFDSLTNIVIRRVTCNWSVNVTMFATDPCGNVTATIATFTISGDNNLPEIISIPDDITLNCMSNLTTREPVIVDPCDGILALTSQDSTNRAMDPQLCEFYNYEIFRKWTGTDACGNSIDHTHNIAIRDTISPEVDWERNIVLDCTADLDDTILFFSAIDDCSGITANFIDESIVDNQCQNQFTRQWTITDVCGNETLIEQNIQAQDFMAPVIADISLDTIIECNPGEVEIQFNNWINKLLATPITDDCNTFFISATGQKGLVDTTEIGGLPVPQYSPQLCGDITTPEIVSEQVVTLYSYDSCGNIAETSGFFTVTDKQAPNIPSCPPPETTVVTDNRCDVSYQLATPTFTDNCLTEEDAVWEISINELDDFTIGSGPFDLTLEQGINQIDYVLVDCGKNRTSCTQEVMVMDDFAPQLTCPADRTVYLETDQCIANISLESISNYDDNCPGPKQFSQTLPSLDGFLTFNFNNLADVYRVSDFVVQYENLNQAGFLFKPRLIVDYNLSLLGASQIEVKDENGRNLLVISSVNCEPQIDIIDITNDQLDLWNADGKIRFTIINKTNTGTGTNPCNVDNIMGNSGSDQVSFFKLTLEYSTIVPDKILLDDITQDTLIIANNIADLSPGTYQTLYQHRDESGNLGECKTALSVVDTISPILNCARVSLEIDPFGDGNITLDASQLNFVLTDNCSVDTLTISPQTLSCNGINSNIEIILTSTDVSDNSASCRQEVELIAGDLDPEFVSGLCFADTLRLFANIPDASRYTFQWTGPDNYTSSDTDPVVTNISSTSSGIYELTATLRVNERVSVDYIMRLDGGNQGTAGTSSAASFDSNAGSYSPAVSIFEITSGTGDIDFRFINAFAQNPGGNVNDGITVLSGQCYMTLKRL